MRTYVRVSIGVVKGDPAYGPPFFRLRLKQDFERNSSCIAGIWPDGARVKVLLQDIETLRFVRSDLGWTANAAEAFDFGAVIHAVDYAVSHQLGAVRPVIKFQDSRYDLRLAAVHSVFDDNPRAR